MHLSLGAHDNQIVNLQKTVRDIGTAFLSILALWTAPGLLPVSRSIRRNLKSVLYSLCKDSLRDKKDRSFCRCYPPMTTS